MSGYQETGCNSKKRAEKVQTRLLTATFQMLFAALLRSNFERNILFNIQVQEINMKL